MFKNPFRLFCLKGKITQMKRKTKGSLKDPLFCFGLIIVFFGIFLFSNNSFLFGSLLKKGKTAFLSVKPSCALTTASEILGKSSLEKFFIRPNKQPANESPNLLFVTKDSLVASGPPVYVEVRTAGVLVDPENENREEIIEYTVQKEDKLLAIAERFGISLDTILWANNLTANSKIRVGQSLII
ncbi:MAG: hypothetical protein COT34_02335, partial [Candidatus Nealsonbacteria bacterium CG08_land_8_20_14_0_20_43_11]